MTDGQIPKYEALDVAKPVKTQPHQDSRQFFSRSGHDSQWDYNYESLVCIILPSPTLFRQQRFHGKIGIHVSLCLLAISTNSVSRIGFSINLDKRSRNIE